MPQGRQGPPAHVDYTHRECTKTAATCNTNVAVARNVPHSTAFSRGASAPENSCIAGPAKAERAVVTVFSLQAQQGPIALWYC